jgi:hypothetical protein
MPARKTSVKKTAAKTAARKAVPRKTSVKKTAARKASVKKAAARKASVKKAVPRKTSVKKTVPRKTSVKKAAAATPVGRTSTGAIRARRGDLIVIDSPQVGSPPREGEVLSVIRGEVSVSYRVRWADGHETLISPAAGTVTIARA